MNGIAKENNNQAQITTSRKLLLEEMFKRAEVFCRNRYGDKDGRIQPHMAGLMQDDLTAITVAHLSNYLPAVLPEFKEHFKQIVVSILDLELASKE